MGDFGQEERDLLVTVAANVENICKKQDTMKSDLDKHIEKDNTFVTRGFWMWVTAGLSTLFMMLIMGAYTYTYRVDHDLGDHSSNLQIHRTEAINIR